MKSNADELVVFENLTATTWLNASLTGRARDIHYIESSWMGRVLARVGGFKPHRLDFRLLDIRDEGGLLLRLRIAFQDITEVQQEILEDRVFRENLPRASDKDLESLYLAKSLVTTGLFERGTLGRALFLIQVCSWKVRQTPQSGPATLFLEKRNWMNALIRYGIRAGVTVCPIPYFWNRRELRQILLSLLPSPCMDWIHLQRNGIHDFTLYRKTQRQRLHSPAPVPSSPRLASEYYGQLNLNQPDWNSDLFFWQQSSLPAKDVLVLFRHPRDPFDSQKQKELIRHGIAAAALRPEATRVYDRTVPVYHEARPSARDILRCSDQDWMREQRNRYTLLVSQWKNIFTKENAKIYVSWYRYDASHVPMTEAMRRVGGLTVFYQRAYDSHGSAELTTGADILFGYSPSGLRLEKDSGSLLRQYVVTGYLGDHRFSLLRDLSRALRKILVSQGAQKIMSFTDENSAEDSRWHTGHDLPRESYAFLCEKVLSEPWFGLLIKPKVPSSLRRRLGPVADLLERAEKTGRCYVFEPGKMQASFPPAAAALGADVAVHGHLCAGTAAVETALAGVPTLLVDQEGWSVSPLYRLGMGQVVFRDWYSLWQTCKDHWFSQPVPGFGDWSTILEELDPFRDGRAAERMGTYLKWLLEGFNDGLNRDETLARTADRYREMWGSEKVIDFVEPVAVRMDRPSNLQQGVLIP